MTGAPNWGRLPAELRQWRQWVVAGPDKAPLSVGPQGLHNASVTDPQQWTDFATAAQAAHANGLHIGFVLHESDPYTCIDFDVKDSTNESDPSKWTTPEQWNRFWEIAQSLDSYTETSRSGKGLHVWVRANIGVGCRRDGIEVYSQQRYIISTGNVVLDRPIADRQQMLENMVSQMRGESQGRLTELVELEEEYTDEEIIDRAINAANADKFNELCMGKWEGKPEYPSQSEADLALMSMFTFYSKSNEQCRRLFRLSILGQREKAIKNDRYLDYTLRVIRNREANEAKVMESGRAQAAGLLESERAKALSLVAELNAKAGKAEAIPLHVPSAAETEPQPAPAAVAATLAGPVAAAVQAAADKGLPWPPGMAGAIAGFIYQSAPRPVKEVAIVGALGFLAGVCGKAWSIPQSGLNLYMILVARSAIGKEAMHSGISAICKAAVSRCPSVMGFVDFSDFASGPALVKSCAVNTSFVNVAGEWGRKLKKIAQDDGRDGAMATLRTVMTNLYQKSGPQAIVGGITYSNKDSNIASVSGVAFSLIGETTPSTFYEALTETMMEDGFLSRFTVVEYDGDRPALNINPTLTPPQSLSDAIGDLCQQAQALIGRSSTVNVGRTNEAAEMMWSFELECDKEINSTVDESWRQMWNRASLKVMRISGLLAVADNWMHPCIEKHHVEWALELIRRDIAIMNRRIEGGDVGMGDHSRERKVLAVMQDYLVKGAADSYAIPKKLQQNGIVPRKYLQLRVQKHNAFMSHKLGANGALDSTLKSMVDSGYIMECTKADIVKGYNFHGKCYQVLNIPDYSAERKK